MGLFQVGKRGYEGKGLGGFRRRGADCVSAILELGGRQSRRDRAWRGWSAEQKASAAYPPSPALLAHRKTLGYAVYAEVQPGPVWRRVPDSASAASSSSWPAWILSRRGRCPASTKLDILLLKEPDFIHGELIQQAPPYRQESQPLGVRPSMVCISGRCLSSSTRRRPRFHLLHSSAGPGSEPNLAKASSSRYWASSGTRRPATRFHMGSNLGGASCPETGDAHVEVAGRTPALKRFRF